MYTGRPSDRGIAYPLRPKTVQPEVRNTTGVPELRAPIVLKL